MYFLCLYYHNLLKNELGIFEVQSTYEQKMKLQREQKGTLDKHNLPSMPSQKLF